MLQLQNDENVLNISGNVSGSQEIFFVNNVISRSDQVIINQSSGYEIIVSNNVHEDDLGVVTTSDITVMNNIQY